MEHGQPGALYVAGVGRVSVSDRRGAAYPAGQEGSVKCPISAREGKGSLEGWEWRCEGALPEGMGFVAVCLLC